MSNRWLTAVEAENEARRSKRRATLTYILGGAAGVIGGIAAFLEGVNWSVVFSPEAAGVAGATVVLVRAIVALVQKPRV